MLKGVKITPKRAPIFPFLFWGRRGCQPHGKWRIFTTDEALIPIFGVSLPCLLRQNPYFCVRKNKRNAVLSINKR